MKSRFATGLTRREALALAGGLGVLPLAAAAQPVAAPIMTRPIPSSGEPLPVVGLGTAYQWWSDVPPARATLGEILRTLIAGGGKVVDTASNFGGYGVAQPMLGALLADPALRSRLFMSTKLEQQYMITDAVTQGASQALGGKLDLLEIHSIVSEAQDLSGLREAKAHGIIRYFGITTAANRYFDAIEAVMRRERPDFIQINCSLENRGAEQRLLPAAAAQGVAVMINMPFGGIEGYDAGMGRNLFSRVRGQKLPEWAAEFAAASWGQFFLKYLLGNPAVTCVIPGTSKPEHMADNLGAGRGRLPDATQRRRMVEYIKTMA